MITMATFKLIAVDTEKGHVTVSYSDNVEQTMCDCPLDSIENRDSFLSEYGDRYEVAIAQAPVIAADITDGVGEEINPA
jgi:hypothetical protein